MSPYQRNGNKRFGKTDVEEKRRLLKKQIEASVWLQAIGQLGEAIFLSRLYHLSDNPDSSGEKTVLTGSWIQAAGQLLEALGVTEEVEANTNEEFIEGQTAAVAGEYLQGIGGLITGLGGTKILEEEYFGRTDFVP